MPTVAYVNYEGFLTIDGIELHRNVIAIRKARETAKPSKKIKVYKFHSLDGARLGATTFISHFA